MTYTIISGKYETGTEEQQFGYQQLFGEAKIQYKFDLYFHWYNMLHETGHCIVEKQSVQMSRVREEMYVNEFAVGYYRFVGEKEKINELQSILQEVIDKLPAPMPEGESFTAFYERIWNTEQINDVVLYGYFQLNSVLEAMKKDRSFEDVLSEIEIRIHTNGQIKKCAQQVASESAGIFLQIALDNLASFGIEVPDIQLELVDNPMIQCARQETK
ncbi:MAG: hypothetical protein IJ567_07225 [Lachnospiraceae bacterium]|nr:hypothetical protein [Lachnospiraceae bacterium]